MSTPRILLVDDSPTVRGVLRAQLPKDRYVVIEAEEGREALRLARETKPDLVLLDVEMPGLDGYAVLAELRADPALRHIPVVFLTGRIDPDHVARGLAAGAYDYLRKPADAAELLARVAAAVRAKRRSDELGPREEEAPSAGPEEGASIVVVDDSEVDRELALAFLRERGYEAVGAPDGATGLTLCRELRPAVMVVDVVLPGSDGLELLDAIRADEALSETPVLILTQRDSGKLAAEGIERGADDFVRKPSHVELLARIEAVLRRR